MSEQDPRSTNTDDRTAGRGLGLGRRSLLGGGAAVVAGTAALAVPGGGVAARSNPARTSDAAEIRQLSIDYAIGTDAIAVGDADTGREIYRRIFTADASITAGFDPSAPSLSSTGPDEWTDAVIAAFAPFTATQHLLGTIDVSLGGNRNQPAAMTSYLQATHVYRDTPELLTVLGTYVDRVERTRDGWRIADRFLRFLSFSTIERTLPPVG
ncbi:nuclear transport factor 2 family protein [Ilumatobacter sp.]|uniref:nuclear transport factor 2 family protein n=1 Tax=Ilumatobacter sp. TaxID=1967498 RepID=UPI003B521B79